MDDVGSDDIGSDDTTIAHRGFFPVVKGANVDMHEAGALAVISKSDVSVTQGGGSLTMAGGNVSIRQGGAKTILAKGDVSLREGGAMLLGARTVQAENSYIGVALGRHVDLTNSRVLLGTVPALALGAAIGVGLAIASKVLSRSG